MFTNLQYHYFLLPLLCPASSGSSAPHIIVFLADDLGYNDIYSHVLTPHIQDLASDGLILEQHYRTSNLIVDKSKDWLILIVV